MSALRQAQDDKPGRRQRPMLSESEFTELGNWQNSVNSLIQQILIQMKVLSWKLKT
jgi:hypothetical protein